MKNVIIFTLLVFLSIMFVPGEAKVIEVNFTDYYQLKYNAAGPLLTGVDQKHNRIIVPHTNAAMLSVIDGRTHQVENIPLGGRAVQHLKDESLYIEQRSGRVYLIGDHCLHVIDVERKTAQTFPTKKQYEMVAVDPHNGNAFLVGRESREIAVIQPKAGSVDYIGWAEKEEVLTNLNQTPPPAIRKVVFDAGLKQVIALDGYTSTLYLFDPQSRDLIKKRQLNLEPGARWHFAGYNQKIHALFVVVENTRRQVIQAAKIDVVNGEDIIAALPGFTEGVGINYNSSRDEVYIPYDNHPSVHVVDFKNAGSVAEIKLPLYGNDATAIDPEAGLLYIACWAYGEVEIVDLKTREFIDRISGLGILPHTFNMSFNGNNKNLYIPIGATAVNGTFGSAVTAIDVHTKVREKIYSGWPPVDLIQLPGSDAFLVFNAEDAFAVVQPDGSYEMRQLPYDYPHQAVYTEENNIYLSYGPHQSYWPNVYIWGAKNGIMQIDARTLKITDRRIPRLAQQIATDSAGALYCLQNSWGNEKQFVTVLADPVREFDARKRIVLNDKVNRETIQRILEYDKQNHWLYLVKCGELDDENGLLQIIDLETGKLIDSVFVGLTPTDLVFDDREIVISNFDSNTLTIVDKVDFSTEVPETGNKPLKIIKRGNTIFTINHLDNTLTMSEAGEVQVYDIPFPGRPDNLKMVNERIILTSHSSDMLHIYTFDPRRDRFLLLHKKAYPYGETTFDTNNNSFYLRGQFGDTIYELNRIKSDENGRLWITDFLSGSLFIIDN